MAKVLIAEDEEAMLEIFGEVIEALGYTVCRARNGEEALLLAQADIPDLVVSDQMMPLRTGIELMHALRADPATAKIPFLLISAALPKGAEDADKFLPKPVDLEALETAVKSSLSARRDEPASETRTASTAPPPTALKEEILNWVAHEMKTPLAAARLNAQLLLRRLQMRPSPDETKHAQAVMRQLDRMRTLVDSILDAAGLSEGRVALQLKPVDLSALVEEAAARWRATHPGIQLHVSGAESPISMTADPTHVGTILDNLISNSVKHAGDAKVISLTVHRSPSGASIDVRDQGPGIEAADLPRLFDRFYRGSNAGSGHGLGLYIAASLARLHGGALSVRSELGDGATFTLRLPFRP